jgi:hypothetical protein
MPMIADDMEEGQKGGARPNMSTEDKELKRLYLQLVKRETVFPEEKFQRLLVLLKQDVKKMIEDLEDDEIREPMTKETMQADVDSFFEGIDNDDKNYVGVINVVTMQCVIMFSNACKPVMFRDEVTVIDEEIVPDDYFLEGYNYISGEGTSWKTYETMRERLKTKSIDNVIFYFDYSNGKIGEDVDVFIIAKFDFTTTEIIEQYFNRTFFADLEVNMKQQINDTQGLSNFVDMTYFMELVILLD